MYEAVCDRETVCELQCASRFQMILDLLLIYVRLCLIRYEHHDDICTIGGFGYGHRGESIFLRLVERFTFPDTYRQIQS